MGLLTKDQTKRKRFQYYKNNADAIWNSWERIFQIKNKLNVRWAYKELHALTQRFTP